MHGLDNRGPIQSLSVYTIEGMAARGANEKNNDGRAALRAVVRSVVGVAAITFIPLIGVFYHTFRALLKDIEGTWDYFRVGDKHPKAFDEARARWNAMVGDGYVCVINSTLMATAAYEAKMGLAMTAINPALGIGLLAVSALTFGTALVIPYKLAARPKNLQETAIYRIIDRN